MALASNNDLSPTAAKLGTAGDTCPQKNKKGCKGCITDVESFHFHAVTSLLVRASAHELKTLAYIASTALRSIEAARSSVNAEDFRETIKQVGTVLEKMVDLGKTLVTMEPDKSPSLATLQFSTTMVEVLHSISQFFPAAFSIELKNNIDESVDGLAVIDKHLLQMALTNLLANAFEVVGGVGVVTVALNKSIQNIDGKEVQMFSFSVEDGGRGSSQKSLSRFQNHFSEQRPNNKAPGLACLFARVLQAPMAVSSRPRAWLEKDRSLRFLFHPVLFAEMNET